MSHIPLADSSASLSVLPVDTVWIVACLGIGLLAHVGFMLVDYGRAGANRSTDTLLRHLTGLAVTTLLYWAVGFGFMFGSSLHGWLGVTHFGPSDGTSTLHFLLFQLLFCTTAAAIIRSVLGNRVGLGVHVAVTVAFALLLYPAFGHWVWGGLLDKANLGWLRQLGFIDGGGATVVHSLAGWFAFGSVAIVGRRRSRDAASPATMHEMNAIGTSGVAMIAGAMFLCIGWIGLNAGSPFAVGDRVAAIVLNTVVSGCSGILVASVLSVFARGNVVPKTAVIGMLAGLVSVSAGCHLYDPQAAIVVASVAAGISAITTSKRSIARIDERMTAAASYAVAGVWGTLAVALVADSASLTPGLSRLDQLIVQTIGAATAFIWSFGVGGLLLLIISKFVADTADPEEGAAVPESTVTKLVSHDAVLSRDDRCEHDQPSERIHAAQSEANDTEDAVEFVGDREISAEQSAALEVYSDQSVDVFAANTLAQESKDAREDGANGDNPQSRTEIKVGKRVLLVTDSSDFADSICHSLAGENCGISRISSTDAREGTALQEMTKNGAFNVVVLDHELDGSDGIEIGATLRSIDLFANVPMVLISEEPGTVPASEIDLVAIDTVLSKTDDREVLRRTIGRLDGGEPVAVTANDDENTCVSDELDGARVLIVDDNDVTQCFTSYVVNRFGGRAVVADRDTEPSATVKEAADNADPFVAVVINCHSSVTRGLEIASEIRTWESQSDRETLRIVGLTNDLSDEQVATGPTHGMSICVPKPFEAEQLIAALTQPLPDTEQEVALVTHETDFATDVINCSLPEDATLGDDVETAAESVALIPEPEGHIALDELSERCLNDESFLIEVLHQFVAELPSEVERVATALANKDASGLGHAVNSLHEFANNVTAHSLADCAKAIRSVLDDTLDWNTLAARYAELSANVEATTTTANVTIARYEDLSKLADV